MGASAGAGTRRLVRLLGLAAVVIATVVTLASAVGPDAAMNVV
jgi:hypothetical protein